MKWIEPVLDVLKAHLLKDVVAGGTLHDDNGLPRLEISTMEIYLGFAGTSRLLRCASVNQYSDLEIAVAAAASAPDVDADGPFATCSLRKVLLPNAGSARAVESLHLIADERQFHEEGTVACAGFSLEGGAFISMDPRNLSGIALGARDAYDRWIEDEVPWRLPLLQGAALHEWVWTAGTNELRTQRTF